MKYLLVLTALLCVSFAQARTQSVQKFRTSLRVVDFDYNFDAVSHQSFTTFRQIYPLRSEMDEVITHHYVQVRLKKPQLQRFGFDGNILKSKSTLDSAVIDDMVSRLTWNALTHYNYLYVNVTVTTTTAEDGDCRIWENVKVKVEVDDDQSNQPPIQLFGETTRRKNVRTCGP